MERYIAYNQVKRLVDKSKELVRLIREIDNVSKADQSFQSVSPYQMDTAKYVQKKDPYRFWSFTYYDLERDVHYIFEVVYYKSRYSLFVRSPRSFNTGLPPRFMKPGSMYYGEYERLDDAVLDFQRLVPKFVNHVFSVQLELW